MKRGVRSCGKQEGRKGVRPEAGEGNGTHGHVADRRHHVQKRFTGADTRGIYEEGNAGGEAPNNDHSSKVQPVNLQCSSGDCRP